MTMLFAEYRTAGELLAALRAMRDRGYRDLDAYTPYPLAEVDEVIGARRSRLPIAVFVAGVVGAGGAYALQWLLNAYLYPLDVGGRPPHMPVAFVPIAFEMGVLVAALTAFAAVLAGARLLRLWDPVFDVPAIESVTKDRFWLRLGVVDDVEAARRDLATTDPFRVTAPGGLP